MSVPDLTRDELLRYSRHIALPEIGTVGQQRLKAGRVLCVGAGGLGSPAAMYLAAAGVGTLGLVDFDSVDLSNLQRQILHGTSDVGRSKLESAGARLQEINPHVCLEPHHQAITATNAIDLVSRYDVVLDGSDNFATRYVVNDACVIAGRPNVYGSIFRFEGQAAVFAVRSGPCYRCLHPEPPPAGLVPDCAEGGVLGILPGVIGTVQATEAIKLLLGIGDPLVGRLLLYDALKMRFRELKLPKDPDCPVCGTQPIILEPKDLSGYCMPQTNSRDGAPDEPHADISVQELKSRFDRGETPQVIDVREPFEFDICRLPGAVLIPLAQLPGRLAEINRDREVILQCKVGARSARAAAFLRGQGFANARNLTGGILAWIDQVDPTLSKY
jgi:sulfur-carrier protein adenylyltransferase/sulfurtransferase